MVDFCNSVFRGCQSSGNVVKTMNRLQNHSSGLFTFTRVNSHKKQPKITVGITISPKLLEEARKRNLNISRITEQALQSILEYVQPQNTNESSTPLIESSEFLNERSFPKESSVRTSPSRGEGRWFESGRAH